MTTHDDELEAARRRALESLNRSSSSSSNVTRAPWYRRPGCFGAVAAVAGVFFALIRWGRP